MYLRTFRPGDRVCIARVPDAGLELKVLDVDGPTVVIGVMSLPEGEAPKLDVSVLPPDEDRRVWYQQRRAERLAQRQAKRAAQR